jgi:hypothetical protein
MEPCEGGFWLMKCDGFLIGTYQERIDWCECYDPNYGREVGHGDVAGSLVLGV